MAKKRKIRAMRKKRTDDGGLLAAYRRIRKPMPPPGKVEPDKRDKLKEEEARRQLRDGG